MFKSLVVTDSACGMADKITASGGVEWTLHEEFRRKGWAWGLIAAGLLSLVYLGTVSLAESLDHALAEFFRLWYWMVPMVGGFALQVGLFRYAKGISQAASGPKAGGVIASGGAGAVSMAACCVHHVTDVLPLVGLTGMGMFFSTYQSLFLLLGILSNLIGTVYMLSLLGRFNLVPSRGSLLSPLNKLSWRGIVPGTVAISLMILLSAVLVEFY